MRSLLLAFGSRFLVLLLTALGALALAFGFVDLPEDRDAFALVLVPVVFFCGLGLHDIFQTRHAVLRNYPIVGHLRYLLENIRPELRQYFFEADTDSTPYSRESRGLVYQRAKRSLGVRPFGTQQDVYRSAHEWIHHSIAPKPVAHENFRISIGGPQCAQPYSASVLNISALSYGAISTNAILALNKGAKLGGFAHDTGEGSVSPYHRTHGGDLIWEIGSSYFGCRHLDGTFAPETFAALAVDPQIKMIELKLSQGAKPGHGGILPGAKVTREVAAIWGVEAGKDSVSPAGHSTFSTPVEMMRFIGELRRLSGGKPTGFKLCVGHPWEFFALIKAMRETDILPDFIVIDGSEGGTGAAPLEFLDHVGSPLRDALAFVHSALVGANLREHIRIGCSGKVASAFDMARLLALGADWCNAARGFMFALGCIQAQQCHSGRCPTGVATQDPLRTRGLVVGDKAQRVFGFHQETLKALAELISAAGLNHPSELQAVHLMLRTSDNRVTTFADQYPCMAPGELLSGGGVHAQDWDCASADTFERVRRA